MEPFAIDDRADRVVVEVVLGTCVLLTDHIDVALEDELNAIFIARGSWLKHDDVPDVVLLICDAMLLCELLKVGDDLLFLLGGARHLCDFVEVLPNDLGVQLGYFHCSATGYKV